MTEFEMIKRHFKAAGVIQIVLGLFYAVFAIIFSFGLDSLLLSVSGFSVFMAVFVITALCLLYLLHVSLKENPLHQLPRAERKKIVRNYQFAKWTVVPFLALLPIVFMIGIKLGLSFQVGMWMALAVLTIPVGVFTYVYAGKMKPKVS